MIEVIFLEIVELIAWHDAYTRNSDKQELKVSICHVWNEDQPRRQRQMRGGSMSSYSQKTFTYRSSVSQ